MLFDFRQPNGCTWAGISGPAAYESPSATYSSAWAAAGAPSASPAVSRAPTMQCAHPARASQFTHSILPECVKVSTPLARDAKRAWAAMVDVAPRR